MINGAIQSYNWVNWVERMLQLNFAYGKKPLVDAFIEISLNVQTILDAYQHFPQTGLNFLFQVKDNFSKEEYEQQILNPLRGLSIARRPELKPVAQSLSTLRKFFGDDPNYLFRNYSNEISSLPGNNKFNTFQLLMKQALSQAINDVTAHLEPHLNQNPVTRLAF